MDEIDRKIISMLQDDGRASLSEIGRELGISHVAVKKRLENLRGDLLGISAGLNAGRLGFSLAIVSAEVESPERLRKFIDVFSRCPRTVFVTTTTGAYNLMVMMIAEDTDTLKAILEACCIRAWKGVRRSDVIVADAPFYPKYLPIRIAVKRESENAPCGINCEKCVRYLDKKCLACPATKHYRGPL